MAYSLLKPYTKEQKYNFINEYNRQQKLRIYYSDNAIYALLVNELWDENKQEPYVDPDYEEKQEQARKERINMLTMTALDFLNVLKEFGFTDAQIEAYLNANLEVKHQLQFCQNVYCGVAKALMPIEYDGITVTAEMVELAFKQKHGEE